MPLVRFDPFRTMLNIHRHTSEPQDTDTMWAPVVDIYEKGDDVVIRAEIAGIEKDDVDISIENGILTIRGERKRETEFDEKGALHLERAFGVFTRSFTLPKTVDSTRITATYSNGVLELTIPKLEQVKPKKIEIKVA